jgi:hypothetical protein
METYFLCCVCASLECSAIDVDLCTRCGRRYCRAHRGAHPCDDTEAPQSSVSSNDAPGATDADAGYSLRAEPPERLHLSVPIASG